MYNMFMIIVIMLIILIVLAGEAEAQGYTLQEWGEWFDQFSLLQWAEWCSFGSQFSTEEWYDYFRRHRYSRLEWVLYWIDEDNWP